MSKSIGIFVDISNIYMNIERRFPRRKLDYGKYLKKINEVIKTDDPPYRAFAYLTHFVEKSLKFIACLRHYGFEPKYKRKKDHVTLAIDVVRVIDKLDVVVIGSSNPELLPLIDWIKEKGVKSIVFGSNVNRDFKNTANQWIEISEDLLEVKNNNNGGETQNGT